MVHQVYQNSTLVPFHVIRIRCPDRIPVHPHNLIDCGPKHTSGESEIRIF